MNDERLRALRGALAKLELEDVATIARALQISTIYGASEEKDWMLGVVVTRIAELERAEQRMLEMLRALEVLGVRR